MNTYITNHMDDIKRALLGDKEAARRLTAAGVLIPCPGCRGEDAKHRAVMACVMIECQCGFMAAGYDLEEARQIWNTRAPILSKIEMERLEGME
jgi:hypothetical protein